MSKNLFDLIKKYPQVYVFEDKKYPGQLKVGYTTKKNAEDRVREQFNTRLQIDSDPYILHLVEDAIDNYDEYFMDHDIHKVLVDKGIKKKGEFFKTDLSTVKSAILSVKRRELDIENRHQTFKMRDEQALAVKMTKDYFEDTFDNYPNIKPQFLWNAKMRFGKTFGTYQLAKQMGFKKVLVLTYKPAVEHSWRDDLLSHIDFKEWQFMSRRQDNLDRLDNTKPFVYFASFQDILGDKDGEVKKHNEWIHAEDWDMIVQDEYHYGAWRDNVKELLDAEPTELTQLAEEGLKAEDIINGKCMLYLSGTPFRAIESGEFADNEIFNWTYADEQRAKANWEGEENEANPYDSLPEMNILTYQLPDQLKKVASRGEFDEFNLSYFFRARGHNEEAEFIHEVEVQKWLDLIEGQTKDEDDIVNELKRHRDQTQIQFPFSKNTNLYKSLNHMLWLMPNVASCWAMEKLLKDSHNKFYDNYEILVAAGDRGGSGAEALIPLMDAIGDEPLKSKTITLTCGKLTTGVTVPPWTGIFMLKSLSSPESYFQAAFRVQSPWVIHEDGKEDIIQKEKCFVFDFDPNRALSQIATYASKLNTTDVNPEEKIQDFIKYLPILAYDGFGMEAIDAAGLLDMSMGQTTSTLLAKGWNNALLINVDNEALQGMIDDDEAMKIINSIESFRRKADGKVDDTIISHSDKIKGLKTKQKSEGGLNKAEKKELTSERREYRNKRQLVREKLQALATRIPLFMYLTDFREEKLTDVIMELEPKLFKKVTGLTIPDFTLLIDLGLFNSDLMNNVVYKFRVYEDASMSYSGINRHQDEEVVGGFDEGKDNMGKCYIPKDAKLKQSRVYFRDNSFILHEGSKVVDSDTGEIYLLAETTEFAGLSEAAKFITGGEHEDMFYLVEQK